MKDKMLKYSVVIPTYKNSPEILERAIGSVQSQSLPDWEILVVDDNPAGSSYKAEMRLLMSRISDPRIRFIFHKRNLGAPAARNTAIVRASGELVAFLDADDEWDKDYLRAVWEKYEKCHAPLISVAYYIKKPGELLEIHENDACRGMIYSKMKYSDIVGPTSAVVVKRSVLLETGGFDKRLPARQDYDLWLRITQKYPAESISTPFLTIHRTGGESVSTRGLNHICGTEMVLRKILRNEKDFRIRRKIRQSHYRHLMYSSIDLGRMDVAGAYAFKYLKNGFSEEVFRVALKLFMSKIFSLWKNEHFFDKI